MPAMIVRLTDDRNSVTHSCLRRMGAKIVKKSSEQKDETMMNAAAALNVAKEMK